MRDIEDRGRDLEHVLHQYTTLVKPAFEEFCLPVSRWIYWNLIYRLLWNFIDTFIVFLSPTEIANFISFQTKKHADVIIPRGADNTGGWSKIKDFCFVSIDMMMSNA